MVTMSLYHEFKQLEQSVAAAQARMNAIAQDPLFMAEQKFDQDLRGLMGEYDKSLRDIIVILDPSQLGTTVSNKKQSGEKLTRTPRTLKRYVNPHTNEVVDTKGGNNLAIKAWKAQYGADTVKAWLQASAQ
jgi:hypothetical protein